MYTFTLRPCSLEYEDGHIAIRDSAKTLIATHKHKFSSKEECRNWCLQVLIPALKAGTKLNREHWRCTRAVNSTKWKPCLDSLTNPYPLF
jgi:hypothetical protein